MSKPGRKPTVAAVGFQLLEFSVAIRMTFGAVTFEIDSVEEAINLLAALEGKSVPTDEQTHHAAAELGRRGGRKGGLARAAKLTAEQRKEIARKAAQARWNK